MKRLNPKTGVPFKQGDLRDDGFIFQGYVRRCANADGTFKEQWHSPTARFNHRIRAATYNAKLRAKEYAVPYDIDTEYLRSIFPADGVCPVLKIPMVFGGEGRSNSPSLDKLIPSLGYVRGNLCWISLRANILKSDVTDPEVFISLAKYMRHGCTTQHTLEVHK
jgi:hypothetical protein